MHAVANAFARAAVARTKAPRSGTTTARRVAAVPIPATSARRSSSPLLVIVVSTLIVLMIVPEGLNYSALAGLHNAPSEGDPTSRILWLMLLGAGLVPVMQHPVEAGRLFRELNPWFVRFAVLAALSTAWSIEPGYTIRRMIRVATFMLDGFAISLLAWHSRQLQGVVRPAITAMLFGSLIFGMARPDLAIHRETAPELLHSWRGLADHKNTLGALACLGATLWAHAGLSGEASRLRAFLGWFICASCLVLSRSSTSKMAMMFSILMMVLLLHPPGFLRNRQAQLVKGAAWALAAYTVITLRLIPGAGVLMSPISMLTGKSANLTGRGVIWDIIKRHIAEHRLLGTGYGAYWTGPHPGAQSYAFVQEMHFYPGSSHDGYLEVVNDLGYLGAIILIGFLVRYLKQCLELMKLDLRQATLFIALFMQEALINVSESHWFSVQNVNSTVMMLTTIAMARSLLQHRAAQASITVPASASSPRLSAVDG